jgi:hypothetical protein
MTCDAIQNRLLALPDLRRVPDELRGHLDGCPACRAYLARAVRLDKLLATIPVPPPSEETKAAFLDRATEAGPVIKRIPVVRRDSGTYLLDDGRWKYTAAALAAAVLVAVGWLAFRGGDAPPNRNDTTTVAGHDLLKKTLGRVVTDETALARSNTSEERMRAWADMTADLREEIEKVHLHAPKDDLKALAGLFEKAARKGLLAEARKMTEDQTPAEKQRAAFQLAQERLTRIAADAAAFAQAAPPDMKPPLQQIRDTAGAVLKELSKLEPRQAGTAPAKGV